MPVTQKLTETEPLEAPSPSRMAKVLPSTPPAASTLSYPLPDDPDEAMDRNMSKIFEKLRQTKRK